MKPELNKIYKSSKAKMWFNDVLQTTVTKIEAKITFEFDDLKFIGSPSSHQDYKGYKGEGSFIRKKKNSSFTKMMADAAKTGVMPDIKIITAIENSGQTERIVYTGVTFADAMLTKFEEINAVDEEIAFSFSDFKILEEIV